VPALLYPDTWTPGTNEILFSAKLGDSTGLWKVSISPKTWQIISEPKPVVTGAGLYRYASASEAGRIAFSNLIRNPDIWSLPIDANRGRVAGNMQRLTQDAADDMSPSISADGRHLVFESNRTGKRLVWTKDLGTGNERMLTNMLTSENLPIISPDGLEVIYKTDSWERRRPSEMYAVPFEGGAPRRICQGGCEQPLQWLFDKRRFLYSEILDHRVVLSVLDIHTGQKVRVLQHPDYHIWSGRLAPDERWISFVRGRAGDWQTQCFVAPIHDGVVRPETTWVSMPCGQTGWSPDGRSRYGVSERDGSLCLYSQKLNPMTKTPISPVLPVHHFHSPSRSFIEDPGWRGPSIARDKIVFTLVELTGNIWLAEQSYR
jgi:Tol biopolymer transport system component